MLNSSDSYNITTQSDTKKSEKESTNYERMHFSTILLQWNP